jgi:hypothetical protein
MQRLLLLLRRLHLRHILGRVLVEVLQAGLAAQIDVRAIVRDFDGFAHAAKIFILDDAFLERVGGRNAFNGRGDASTEEQAGEEDEDGFHEKLWFEGMTQWHHAAIE